MKSIGSFNSITATSLLMCDKETIDMIWSLTTKKIDEYTAEDMKIELLYTKDLLRSEKIVKVCNSRNRVTDLNSVADIFRGIGSVLSDRIELRNQNSGIDSVDTVEGDETNFFSDDFDLLGDLDVESDSTYSEEIKNLSISDLINKGEFNSEFNSGDFERLKSELIEYDGAREFFKIRTRKAEGQLREAIWNGTVKYDSGATIVWGKYVEFNRSIIQKDKISAFDLSLEELNYLIDLLKSEGIWEQVIGTDEEEPEEDEKLNTVLRKIREKAFEEITEVVGGKETKIAKIDYCIKKWFMKSSTLGGTRISVLGIPVNLLCNKLVGNQLVEKVQALEEEYKSTSDINRYLDRILAEIDSAIDYINRLSDYESIVELDSSRNVHKEIELIGEKRLELATEGTFISQFDSSTIRMKKFLTEMFKHGFINKKTNNKTEEEREELRRIDTELYRLFLLYEISDKFSIESLKEILNLESLTATEFIQLNEELGKHYNLIPFTMKELVSESILGNSSTINGVDILKYKSIVPNLNLLKKNFSSRKKMVAFNNSVRIQIG